MVGRPEGAVGPVPGYKDLITQGIHSAVESNLRFHQLAS